jgi:hypothetical protein
MLVIFLFQKCFYAIFKKRWFFPDEILGMIENILRECGVGAPSEAGSAFPAG